MAENELVLTGVALEQYEATTVAEIRGAGRISIERRIFIGMKLVEAKTRLPHGRYESFVTGRLGYSLTGARDHVRLYEAFKSSTVEDLDVLGRLEVRSQNLISAPSVTVETRAKVISRVLSEASEPGGIHHEEVKRWVEEVHPPASKKPRTQKPPPPDSALPSNTPTPTDPMGNDEPMIEAPPAAAAIESTPAASEPTVVETAEAPNGPDGIDEQRPATAAAAIEIPAASPVVPAPAEASSPEPVEVWASGKSKVRYNRGNQLATAFMKDFGAIGFQPAELVFMWRAMMPHFQAALCEAERKFSNNPRNRGTFLEKAEG